MDYLNRILSPTLDRNMVYIISASVITTFAVLTVSRRGFRGKQGKILPSPRETLLPKLTKAEIEALPYPPDVLPGGRDVESPVCPDYLIWPFPTSELHGVRAELKWI